MGIFTWTDASVKKLKTNKWGDYRRKDVIEYGSPCRIVCPDDSEIFEPRYAGYGVFGGYDAYDLVAEWNRKDVVRIIEESNSVDLGIKPMAAMFAEGKSDEEITEYVKNNGYPEFLVTDWKRNIGIAIACDDEDNEKLEFPLKITRSDKKLRYSELYKSYSTQ